MWKRIKDNFIAGIEKIKWFSTFFSERIKVEFSLFKLLQERDKKEKAKAEKMKIIGERVFELKAHSEKNILKDGIIVESMKEAEKLDAEIEDLKQKASEISGIEG